MPRWVFLLGVGLLLVAVAFVVTCAVLGPSPGVTEANARRIKPGMTLCEVKAILGERHKLFFTRSWTSGPFLVETVGLTWKGQRGKAVVVFLLPEQIAQGWSFDPAPAASLLPQLRAWLGQ